MPKFKGISVSINPTYNRDSQGPFPEYGTYTQRRNSRITTYIPSSSNTAFAVSIEMDDDYKPMTSMPNESLAAYLYFDGRKQEETATLLRRGSETWISSRWVTMANGELAEKEFYFKEIGLEVFLTGLDIKKDKDTNGKRSAGDDSEGEVERATAGQIRVDLYRVVPEGPVRKGEYKPLFTENENEDVEDKNAAELEHTAGFGAPKPLYKESISVQSVSHLDAESAPYASFIFFYRGERQLQKMGVMPKGTHISKPASPTKGILSTSPGSDNKTLQGLKDALNDKSKRKSYSGYRNGRLPDDDDEEEDDEKDRSMMDHDDDKEVAVDKDAAVDQDLTEGVRKIKLKRSLEDAADAYKRADSDSPPNSPPPSRMRSRPSSTKHTPSSQRRFANPSSAANKFSATPNKPAPPDENDAFSPAKRRRESRAMDIGSSNMISEEDML